MSMTPTSPPPFPTWGKVAAGRMAASRRLPTRGREGWGGIAFALLLSACGADAGLDESRDVDPSLLGDVVEAPDDEGGPAPGFAPESARDDQVAALDRANFYRWQSNLPPLDMIEGLNLGAQAHCDYWVKHIDQYGSTGLSPHQENPAWSEGFTGQEFWQRAEHFGYAYAASEVIAFVHNPDLAVDGWMATLYHRIPFMSAQMVALGYGAAESGGWQNSTKIDTVDFGTRDASGKAYMGPELEGIYPPPGSSGIPVLFDGMESPQPPPPPNGYPSGTIVSVTWSSNAGFKVDEHRIWAEEDQVDLPHVWLDPGNDGNLSGAATIALYPNKPLDEGKRYWVHIKGEKNGAPWEKTWDFYTVRY